MSPSRSHHRRRLTCALVEPLEHRQLLSANPARQAENLDRGIIAVNRNSTSVYVSWRLLGTDPSNIAFNLYRVANGGAPLKLNSSPLTATTDFTDTGNGLSETNTNAYFVRPVINGVEQAASPTYTIPANTPVRQYINIPLVAPPSGQVPDVANPGQFLTYTYNANDASTGDLDGDGKYEIILKWDTSLSKDSSQDGFTGPTYFDAYKLDGTRMWRINLGNNIRAGAHYTQFIVYDLDGDGKAEVVMKTAPGTIDGQGDPVLLGSDQVTADYRSATTGRINTGSEYLTVFNGQTGAAMATVPFKPDRVNTSSWGDDYGNRQDRILMAVAYLDGQRPSLVVGRGIFPAQSSGHAVRNELTAWDWRNGQLTMRWWFRADQNTGAYGLPNVNTNYVGQGNYEMQPADVDGDGKDEIIYGSMTVNDNGAPLYSTGLGHGDALYVSDMIPSRPGLETYMPMESPGSNGHITANVHDAGTGTVLWDTHTRTGDADPDVGRGSAFDIDPRYPGFEVWDSYNTDIYNLGDGSNLNGTIIQTRPSNMFVNFGIWWDADPMRELLDGTTIGDWRLQTSGSWGRTNYIFAPSGLASNNGSKSTPCLVADLFGDWREEVVWRRSDNTALQIWTTTIAATTRMPTLMQDIQYRESVAWQNVGYNQPTATSFYLGSIEPTGTQFAPIPTPNIYLAGVDTTPPTVVDSSYSYNTPPIKLGVKFSEDVSQSIAVSDLLVQLLGTSTTITPTGVSYDAATNTATWTFPTPLPDGNYRATLAAANITDVLGNPMASDFTTDFFALAGDANHDRSVDVTDLGILATHWQSTGGVTFSDGDFNYDGTVDVTDLGTLATNWQKTQPTPAAPSVLARSQAPVQSTLTYRPLRRTMVEDVLS